MGSWECEHQNYGVRRQSGATTALWVFDTHRFPLNQKRCRASLATALQKRRGHDLSTI